MKQQANKVDFYQVIQRRRIGSLKEFFDREGILTQAQYYLWRSEADSVYTFSEKFEEELKKIVFKHSAEETNILEHEKQKSAPQETEENSQPDIIETKDEVIINKRIYKKKVQTEEEPVKIEE